MISRMIIVIRPKETFSNPFLVNILLGSIENLLMGPIVLEDRLTFPTERTVIDVGRCPPAN
jgi:hypothetical protein